jgi:ADP-ribosylglycohydrolase
MDVPEMHHRRAPGNTCLSALSSGVCGSIEKPINNSKGCGGVMRVAPIGLYQDKSRHQECEDVALLGAQVAAITHGHELGYIPAAALVWIIHDIAYGGNHGERGLAEIIAGGIEYTCQLFADKQHVQEFKEIMDKATALAAGDKGDRECIALLGQGWVAEETLAIAVFCALRHTDDFEQSVIAAVNHSGDSDSTGAVCGNIMGAWLGYHGLPQRFLENLELRNEIIRVADELYDDYEPEDYTYPIILKEKQ